MSDSRINSEFVRIFLDSIGEESPSAARRLELDDGAGLGLKLGHTRSSTGPRYGRGGMLAGPA
jgi:hypothetical protein